jgi:hypothetical protein
MAAPNIVNVTTIFGRTAVLAVTTTATAIVTNSAGSNKVFKVNSLYVANVDGTNNAEITADVFRSSTAYRLASTVVVPADATLTILSTPIYLEEGDSIRLTANANGDLEAVCSYEDISSS